MHRERAALCAIIAVIGATLVVQGNDLQGFIWWTLLCVLIGVLLDGTGRINRRQRLLYSPWLALIFIITCVGLYLVLGYGLSGYRQPGSGTGLDISKIRSRLRTVDLEFVLIHGGVWLVTGFLIALANSASQQIFTLLTKAWEIKESALKAFKRRFNLYVSIAALIFGAVGWYAGKGALGGVISSAL